MPVIKILKKAEYIRVMVCPDCGNKEYTTNYDENVFDLPEWGFTRENGMIKCNVCNCEFEE